MTCHMVFPKLSEAPCAAETPFAKLEGRPGASSLKRMCFAVANALSSSARKAYAIELPSRIHCLSDASKVNDVL